jgi:hypothetical protein
VADRLTELTARRGPFPQSVRAALRTPTFQVIAIYAAARAFTTIALLLISTTLDGGSRAGASPGFFDYSALWDGQWYWFIAANGYPSTLPLDDSGYVAENQWAFMPVFPGVVTAIAAPTGLYWPIAGFLVALACGFAAAVVIYKLFRTRLDHPTSLFAVAVFAVSPLSFILQMAYAESMQLLLLALALLLLIRRRWGWLALVIPVMALTRPTALAFALALGIYFLARLARREPDPFPNRERWWVVGLAALSTVAGFAWLLIAWAVTGSLTAYTDTELAWRASWIGHGHLLPFAPWFQAAPFWVGPAAGPFVVIGIAVAFALVLVLPPVRRLGIEMRAWMAAYAVYLFAVFFPQSSLLRLLMPLFPLAGAIALARPTWIRVAVIAVCLVLQVAWMWATWGPTVYWWSIP